MFQNPGVKFSRVLTKNTIDWEFLENLSKISGENSKNALFRAYDQQNFKKQAFFVHLENSEKILKFFDKPSLENLNFSEKLLIKIDPSEITSFFYKVFFYFWGVHMNGY